MNLFIDFEFPKTVPWFFTGDLKSEFEKISTHSETNAVVEGVTKENCNVALKEDKVNAKNLSELKGFYEKRGTLMNF